ncbi:MAG: 4-hydroxythreonine-4-phosphate dehydrogenase PdxA [Acetobacteraceae bacterium]|nr:4-hydroxythreonine-4-phosphate dehydrogenase PdxA [Acetobacteraceae bacterium]
MSGSGVLALTLGEPGGIAPEITAKAWRALRGPGPAFCWLGDEALVQDVPTRLVERVEDAGAVFADALPILRRPVEGPVRPGHADPRHAPAVIASIAEAVALAKAGRAAAVVTNPIQKASLTAAGFAHPGHTEFLGELAGTGVPPVMMLASPYPPCGLRVVPVTVHEPLRRAIARLDSGMIVATSRVVDRSLREMFGIAEPRLAVAGLNPHAGEAGTLGEEDEAIVAPAVRALQAEGIRATGPHPPDTMFTADARRHYDAAICLYHDQALIPIKTLDVSGGVNVTLGIAVIRTSPDHGTALDIAGRGVADPSSLIAALRLAHELARKRA